MNDFFLGQVSCPKERMQGSSNVDMNIVLLQNANIDTETSNAGGERGFLSATECSPMTRDTAIAVFHLNTKAEFDNTLLGYIMWKNDLGDRSGNDESGFQQFPPIPKHSSIRRKYLLPTSHIKSS